MSDLQHEVRLVDALDATGLDGLNERRPVVGVDDSLADLESHVLKAPSVDSRVTRT